MSIYTKVPFRLQQWNGEECVEERGEERYCWRAGVMSRNEGGEGRGTLCMNSLPFFESIPLVKSNSSERGHVCL